MRVVHKSSHVPGAIYIGRGSIFGNPYVLGQHGNRVEVIEQYRRRLWRFWQTAGFDSKLVSAIMELPADAVLECYCAPQACHGDVIVRARAFFDAQAVAPTG